MVQLIFSNNAATTLASSISSTITQLTVASGKGALFPQPQSGEAFYATLFNTNSQGTTEIVLCTARDGDTLTIARGQDGTTATAWAAGDAVQHQPNAATMRAFLQGDPLSGLVGSILAYAGSTAPSGWLECDGRTLSIANYPSLYAVIGTTYGGGSGTFLLPDLRGLFVRGWDHERGLDPGRPIGDTQADSLRSHTHTVPRGDAGGGFSVQNGPSTSGAITTSATGGTETRPVNLALMYIIKY